MGKRGGNKHVKRLAFPPILRLKTKKGKKWIVKSSPGRHNKETSVPLLLVIRDLLGFAKTAREARKIVRKGKVLVDGRVVKDERLPVGIMDVITFKDLDKSYRLMFDVHGKLIANPIDSEEVSTKVCKVMHKFMMPKGRIGITLHDGKTLIADNSVKVGDSVILELPANKIKSVIKLEPGVHCYVYQGRHIGREAVLEEIKEVKGAKKQVRMRGDDGEEFYTVLDYIMAVKPASN